MTLLFSIRRWIVQRTAGIRSWARSDKAQRIRYERVVDFPEQLSANALYVAGEQLHLWAAAMLCPCGCGDAIHLNLLEQQRPCWTVKANVDGTISVLPSVWRTKGCRSHFFIRNSRIEWCRTDSGRSSAGIRIH